MTKILGPNGRPLGNMAEQNADNVEVRGGRVVGLREFAADRARVRELDVTELNAPATVRWTPVPTFADPGDVAFSTPTFQLGRARLFAGEVLATFRLAGVITHLTAAGALMVTGLPYVPADDAGFVFDAPAFCGGVTLGAGYTQVVCSLVAGSPVIYFSVSGSAVAPALLSTGNVPTGNTLILRGTLKYPT